MSDQQTLVDQNQHSIGGAKRPKGGRKKAHVDAQGAARGSQGGPSGSKNCYMGWIGGSKGFTWRSSSIEKIHKGCLGGSKRWPRSSKNCYMVLGRRFQGVQTNSQGGLKKYMMKKEGSTCIYKRGVGFVGFSDVEQISNLSGLASSNKFRVLSSSCCRTSLIRPSLKT